MSARHEELFHRLSILDRNGAAIAKKPLPGDLARVL